jgi:hypothetical protein
MRQALLLTAGAALLTLSVLPADAAGSYGYCHRYAQRMSANYAPPAPAGAFAGGAAGAIGGAVFGGIIGGSKGAGTGALIGAGVGAVAGASANERKHRKIYDQAFRDCMAGRVY